MNHTKSHVSSAIAICRKSIQFLTFHLKAQGSIQQIQNRNTALTSTFANLLDRPGTLRREPFRGSTRAASRIARGVAFAIGISLSVGIAPADGGSIDAIKPKQFIRLSMDKREAKCLIKLYGKESAFNHLAIGNLKGKIHTYGIPQLKNPIIYDKTPIQQIQYGIKYINHRYQGDTCKAWSHWLRKGWH